MLWLPSTFITFSVLQVVYAQSDASCLPFYNWALNSQKKTPCEVASSLLAVCNGGPFPVSALPDASHYAGPTLQTANACQCNSVVYSLMSACGACQGRTYLSWSVWSANCPMVSIDVYPEPIPAGVAVPGWAYLDVKATDNWDISNAIDNANITESTAIPAPTSTVASSHTSAITKTTSTKSASAKSMSPKSTSAKLTSAKSTLTTPASSTITSSVISPTASTESSASSTLSSSHANAIGGGIVGGLVGLGLLLGLLYFFVHRRRKIAKRGQQLPSPSASQNGAWQGNGQGPYMSQVASPQNPGVPASDPSVSDSADSVRMGRSHV